MYSIAYTCFTVSHVFTDGSRISIHEHPSCLIEFVFVRIQCSKKTENSDGLNNRKGKNNIKLSLNMWLKQLSTARRMHIKRFPPPIQCYTSLLIPGACSVFKKFNKTSKRFGYFLYGSTTYLGNTKSQRNEQFRVQIRQQICTLHVRHE